MTELIIELGVTNKEKKLETVEKICFAHNICYKKLGNIHRKDLLDFIVAVELFKDEGNMFMRGVMFKENYNPNKQIKDVDTFIREYEERVVYG